MKAEDRDIPKKVQVTQVTTVRFTFVDGDWCEASLNETSGMLTISGDAGHYSYGWRLGSNLGIKPPYTLLRGVDGFGVDYLSDKLLGASGLVYDPEGTERAVREYVGELAWEVPEEELDRLDFDSPDALLYSSREVEWLEHAHEFFAYTDTRAARALRRRYLPALKAWVADRVALDSATPSDASP